LKNEEILRWAFLLVLIVSIVSSFIIIPAFSEGAQIWTEDWQGENRTDFEPDESVYIRGSGFNENVQITITRPDNVVENHSTSSDENGCFLYIYTLDGMLGTYYVTATDNVNSASTTFEDSLKHLEGYDKAAGRWERGLLEGWKELDWVPYRIKFSSLPTGVSNFNFSVCHNNLLDNKDGIDKLRNFRVGDVNGNPVDGSVTASGPFYKTPGKGCDRDIYYSLSVTFNIPSSGLSWYVYWEAHVAFGASQWPGAKLHAYTENLTGSQDVPIKVPPTPVGSISGAKWNDLSYNGIWDLGEPGLSSWTIQLYFFDNVENIWINLDNKDTGAGGSYTFSKLVAGNYRLTEVLKANWVRTYPPSPGSHYITLSEGENRSGVNFGNILIMHGVEVSISPPYQSGSNGEALYYTVTVANTGNVSDTYDLSVSDDLLWGPSVSPTSLAVPAGENKTATLSVTIPNNAIGCTQDIITVTATSRSDSVSDNASCIAHVTIARGVQVLIAPPSQENENGGTLAYTVTVKNTGNVGENFQLTKGDNAVWMLSLDDDWLLVPKGENRTTRLTVTIPTNARGCTWDNIWVKATSKDNVAAFDNKSCLAHVKVVRGVDVSISPNYQSGLPGATLNYIVTVKNTGNVPDNYGLENVDTLGWSLSLGFLIEVPAGENRTTTLTVDIPGGAHGCTEDKITVITTSKADNTVRDNASCTAHVENVYGVGVSISPPENSAKPGRSTTFTVTVTNTGNITDTYDLTVSDNLGWGPTLSPTAFTLADGASGTATLTVLIPDNQTAGTRDNIRVRATSRADNRVSAENSAVAYVAAFLRKVKVSLTPTRQENSPGGMLNYTVVVANEGDIADNYALTASDNENWGPTVTPSSLAIAPGASDNAALSVTIPEKTWAHKEATVVATATSTENAGVAASDMGVAKTSVVRGVDVSISPGENEALPGENTTYVVTITNTGNVEDTYDITVSNNAGWEIVFSLTWVKLSPYGSAVVAELIVIVPEDAVPGTPSNTTVTAVSENDPEVRDNDSCIARAKVVRGVGVSILENYQENEEGGMLNYTVVIANTGNVPDNYALENIDTLDWGLSLSESLLENVENGASEIVTLTVAIPDNVMGCTLDNITVTATSQENENVSDSESCLAHVKVLPGVDVRIEPGWQENFFGDTLTYTITVINKGNAMDNYILTVQDIARWGLTLSDNLVNDNRIENLAPGENRTVTLTVTILDSAEYCKEDDTITVTATSVENAEISDDASCMGYGISWTGWARLWLENLYKVGLEKDLQLYAGRKLVVKFYKYDNATFQTETVIHSFTPRENIKENENAPQLRQAEGFSWGTVQIARLVLTTDNTKNVISTIASFTVHQSHLRDRDKAILTAWGGHPELHDAFMAEDKDILEQWSSAPP